MREVYQLKKAGAIIKFEGVMANMLTKALRSSTLSTLREVKEPIFNKQYAQVLDQLSSYH